MRPAEEIETVFKKAQIQPDAGQKQRIWGDAADALQKQQIAIQPRHSIWRQIMNNKLSRFSAAAATVLVIISVMQWHEPIVAASTVYAAAVETLKQARTFSCTESFTAGYQDEEKEGTYLLKQQFLFKEPDLKRHVTLTSPWPRYVGEVSISNFAKRQRLILRPAEKTARLYSIKTDYTIDNRTGQLKLTQLNTDLRDRLLELTQGTIKDLGRVDLDGQNVRKLESNKGERVTSMWIDPRTGYPVQIEHRWTHGRRKPVLYSSIQIDSPVDEQLFSLDPPEDYRFTVDESAWPEEQEKMGAKLMHLIKLILYYANKHNDQYPGSLKDLVASEFITDEALEVVLARPGDLHAEPVIQYRKPNTEAEDWGQELVLYEIRKEGSGGGMVVVSLMATVRLLLIPIGLLIFYGEQAPIFRIGKDLCLVLDSGLC
jgi:outer membrane lipoprotein-sorting protein